MPPRLVLSLDLLVDIDVDMVVVEWRLVVVDEIGLVDQSRSLTLRYHAKYFNVDAHGIERGVEVDLCSHVDMLVVVVVLDQLQRKEHIA